MDSTTKKKQAIPFFKSLWRSQASSLVSTITDFGIYGILLYGIQVHYATSSAIGNICGAIVSFYLGRNWAFKKKSGKMIPQAIKYAITSIVSAAINTAGILYLTENSGIDSTYSKIIVSFFVGIFFNFLMFRYFVFRK